MEYSSPLAAIRPQPHPGFGGNRKDIPDFRSINHGCNTIGPFDFKAMSMHTQKPRRPDYFSLRPVRGSSPTASLTADLDANFHIDKSPAAPTPRRSLFTTDLFRPRENVATPPIEIEPATTPPIVSSSPYCDAMDISPLPHKLPLTFQVTLPSPTPELTPEDVHEISPDLLQPDGLSEPPPSFLALPEPVTRPALSRTKGYSASCIPQRPSSAETQLPPFRFGNVATSGLACSSTPCLLDSFTDSPVDELRPSSAAGSMPPPPRRTSLSQRNNGSPSAGHVRKPSAGRPNFVRPQRKMMRRSLSMFQHPDDVMKEEQDTFESQPSLLSSVMDVEQEHSPKLPHFVPDEPDSLPRISQETMIDVLDSKYTDQYDRIVVVDCRFEYEYEGGHIDSAVNFNDKQQLATELFCENVPANTLLIFHCEYSVHRAPLTAKFIRSHDRTVNAANYPNLTYPEMYILDGGYSKFFSEHPSKCFPQNYVEMNDQRHEQACERGMAKVKNQRQKLFRNQTFAFGQNDDMEDSPTALGRTLGPRSQSTFAVGADIAEGIGQSFQRRMASY
ncbi:M-phase inducer phosphatase [Fulvia fulva]|uniref:M-phase inducer phosphatase n=1 Tax=Passalora fulva TaxID=5499 RepID=A0A9Q8PFI0_PASFU|nr:M-phase inducer phosphatase [Fulvia fulva]KAK4613373.1 M-phase inducer phosphatase [Fulvia fulva]KAK4615058.1 M-phase inducer phosphatase [Fulvia fulva]UJO21644.1 M-phase inducer phosphatase [Fulvia fulva]WPV20110.1 M-phase inducer phosphatase [Fulvia fulva]WPV35518.1 M-phase inducer phosphatase [Fulvia fulva]